MIQAALYMAFAVIAEASLSFLGLGAAPPTPTIGLILNAARPFLTLGAWWFVIDADCSAGVDVDCAELSC